MRIRAFLAALVLAAPAIPVVARTAANFNDGWTFERNGVAKPVQLPHDWAIGHPFDPKLDDKTGMLPWKGEGAYRRTLTLDAAPKGRVYLDFDGVMSRATVYVNGSACGNGDYGYLGFRADATPYLCADTNVIEVFCDTKELSSRWYPGGGIYRDVRLVTTDDVHLEDASLRIVTDDVLSGPASVRVRGEIVSFRAQKVDAEVRIVLRDPAGQAVAFDESSVTVDAFGRVPFDRTLRVARPELWRMGEDAKLYKVEVAASGEGFSDALTTRIGFRTFRFDAAKGFFLNGERVQLKGVDLHADLGPLGMAFNKDAMRRQLSVMRDMGANAVRTSHNCPAPQLLDLCDEMGFFVWDECFDSWDQTTGRGRAPLDEFVPRILAAFVRRDRNHPCVFVWSMGNEIPPGKAVLKGKGVFTTGEPYGTSVERCSRFRLAIRAEDETRPVGIGCCIPFTEERGDNAPLDVVGWNYGDKYFNAHRLHPDKPVLDSESASTVSEVGFYPETLPTNKLDYGSGACRLPSYDFNACEWSDIPDWEFYRMECDTFCCGEFVWSGIDYLGEPTPFKDRHVARSSYFGICDICVLPKDRYYLYRSHWNPAAFTLHLVPGHWTFPERIGRTMPVFVYTSADEAELFVNGRSLGRRRKARDLVPDREADYWSVLPRYRLMWMDVPYEPGEVKAVAYAPDGKVLGEEILRTAGKPVRVVLTPERRYGNLCVVKVTLADRNGTPVPESGRRIRFAAAGCTIAAVGNSDPCGKDSFKAVASHPLFSGRAAVYLRLKDGQVGRLAASAEGLESAEVIIRDGGTSCGKEIVMSENRGGQGHGSH